MKAHFANGVLCLHLMLSVAALRPWVCRWNQLTKCGKKRRKIRSLIKHVNTTSFAQRSLMRFLKFAEIKETWTWETCFRQ